MSVVCQHFLDVFACVPLPAFFFRFCSSFIIFSRPLCFLQLQLSLYPLWDPLIILCCFKPIIQTMYTVFLSIIPPDSICIFLDGAPTSVSLFLSIRPSVMHHFSGTVHHLIIILVHMCKMMISPGVFFISFKCWFFGLLGGWKGKK